MRSVRSRQSRRPRLLVLNQYYWPGVEATAHLLSELCEELAGEFDVRVVTGMLHGTPAPRGHVVRNGVEIVRVRSTAFERRVFALRALNYITYVISSLRAALTSWRPDAVLTMTDPPIIGDIGLIVARRFRVPLVVISQDVFPEIAVELGRLRNPAIVAALRLAIRAYLRRAAHVVAIGETMRRRLEEKGTPPERLSVIPNWVDTATITPRPRENPWSSAHDLSGRFVVMHSGNVGYAQNLDALIRAGSFLRDLDDLRIVVIGIGARHAELVALAELLEVDVMFLPYQPRELLGQSLSSANVHVVGLARGLSGYVVPSRLYGILAAGRPVIVAADEDSETARVIEEAGAGIVVDPGRPELLAAAIRSAHSGELDLAAMGEAARAYVVNEADRSIAFTRYRTLLRDVVGPAR
jgi:colanic acid biosynthesis glycosyl transferase WcaI